MAGFLLYARAGCHLCEVAAAALRGLQVPFEEIDIAGKPELERLYGWDIPVLVSAQAPQKVLAKGVINAARLRRILAEPH